MAIAVMGESIQVYIKHLVFMVQHIKKSRGMLIKTIVVLFSVIFLIPSQCFGQTDTVKNFKNTVRINITNPMLFGSQYTVFGYERVIKAHQTASISIGRIGFPRFKEFNNDSLGLTNQAHDKGFNFSIDYRFYLKRENKYKAPHGIYLGPYYAFNSFSRDLTWNLNTGGYPVQVKTDFRINANLIGAQMGYQFVLWKRVTIDMILMGPGLWFFNMRTTIDTNLPTEDEAMLIEKLNEMLKEKFPGSNVAIQGGTLEAKRVTHTSAMGFRYLVNLGFRF